MNGDGAHTDGAEDELRWSSPCRARRPPCDLRDVRCERGLIVSSPQLHRLGLISYSLQVRKLRLIEGSDLSKGLFLAFSKLKQEPRAAGSGVASPSASTDSGASSLSVPQDRSRLQPPSSPHTRHLLPRLEHPAHKDTGGSGEAVGSQRLQLQEGEAQMAQTGSRLPRSWNRRSRHS